MTRLGLIVLAALATSTRAWPRLDAALANYPSIHARETARLKAGDASAKFVLVVCYHGLGNRHHALVSAFALALARDAALYVDWPDQRCNKWAQAGDAAACEASRATATNRSCRGRLRLGPWVPRIPSSGSRKREPVDAFPADSIRKTARKSYLAVRGRVHLPAGGARGAAPDWQRDPVPFTPQV